jgi:hypothetical protein
MNLTYFGQIICGFTSIIAMLDVGKSNGSNYRGHNGR